jgi:hypothetical protein
MTSNIVRSGFFVESEKDTEGQVVLALHGNDTGVMARRTIPGGHPQSHRFHHQEDNLRRKPEGTSGI